MVLPVPTLEALGHGLTDLAASALACEQRDFLGHFLLFSLHVLGNTILKPLVVAGRGSLGTVGRLAHVELTTFRFLGFFLVPAFLVLTEPVTFNTVWPMVAACEAVTATASMRTPTTAPISLRRTLSSWMSREKLMGRRSPLQEDAPPDYLGCNPRARAKLRLRPGRRPG